MNKGGSTGIAIIGMAGRFPGARDVDAFWENLKQGRESISFFTDEELLAEGIDPELLQNPRYVRARSIINDIEMFDALFFGINPREAEMIDPQQRVFLEVAWEALESAGYDADRFGGSVGVYAGAYWNTYLLHNLCASRSFINDLLNLKHVGSLQTFLGADKDHMATRVAYKLNLRGPAITLQTACSTSLVAVCQAVSGLLTHQCDMALAGGAAIVSPQTKGYLYSEGGMVSPNGQCRAFDAQAAGTVFGNGVGIVVLKRLDDAIAHGDNIIAVIKGAGLNNDGSQKVSYTAPSVQGQADAIKLAQTLAGTPADTITYVETHGTGTLLGDPIEVEGLTRAFRASTDKKGFCAIGSVKSNVGHLDVAAGVTGLIKTALALKHKAIPPTLHFEKPNAEIDFASTPFYVNNKLIEWKTNGCPRRAGVSAFGVGGTNAHVVLEEAPQAEQSSGGRKEQLLVLSAKTSAALDTAVNNLGSFLQARPEVSLPDVAFTLQVGRKVFEHRCVLVASDVNDAAATLVSGNAKRVRRTHQERRNPPIVFLFPGQGSQYVNMGRQLYEREQVFREEIDRAASILQPILEMDLRHALFPQAANPEAEQLLQQTCITQPAIFSVEYALAKLWISWGIKPSAMVGHSVGEYVAGCLAEVFTPEEALLLVAERARLVQQQPSGAMLAVFLSEADVIRKLPRDLSIAAVNSPSLTVVAGPHSAIDQFEKQLEEQGTASVRLTTSHAFHSAMMDPVLPPFTETLKKINLRVPKIPYVSNVTAKWITAEEATSPAYWAGHVRQAVRFNDALTEICKDSSRILLEVGPGQTLSALSRHHPGRAKEQIVLASLPTNKSSGDETTSMLKALGELWLAGIEPDWTRFYRDERRQRVALPTYPFERKRYWVDPPRADVAGSLQTQRPVIDAMPPRQENPVPAVVTPRQKPVPAKNNGENEEIRNAVRKLLVSKSGVQITPEDDNSSFALLGFDSLFLTQMRVAFDKEFGVKITSRQMQEDLSHISALADFIAQHGAAPVPVESRVVSPETPKEPNRSVNTIEPATIPPKADAVVAQPDGVPIELQDLIRQQLQIMQQQLALLQRGAQPQNLFAQPQAGVKGTNGNGDSHPNDAGAETHGENGKFISPVVKTNETRGAELQSFPLTDAQREIWMASQVSVEASCAYNESVNIEIKGGLDADIFRAAMADLVARHEGLRTTFAADGSRQRILNSVTLEIPLEDLSNQTEAERASRLNQLLEAQGDMPFNLEAGPLLRVRVVRLDSSRHIVIFTAHHVVCDGWTMTVLLDELAELYSSRVKNTPSTLPPAYPFSKYAERERQYNATGSKTEAFWLTQFSGEAPVLNLPTDNPRRSTRNFKGDRETQLIDRKLAQAIKSAAAQLDCTPFVYFLSAFKLLLARWTGQNDVVVGTPVSAQNIIGETHLVGHCINLLPLRSRLNETKTFADFVRGTRAVVFDAMDHQDFTFSRLIQKLNIARDQSRVPLVQATFNLNRPFGYIHFGNADAIVRLSPQRRYTFDVSFSLAEEQGGYSLECSYNAEIFTSDTMRRFVNCYKVLLEQVVADGNRTLSAVNILPEDERTRVVVEWNKTATNYPQKCIHQLFEEQAEKTPAAIALTFDGQELSYDELNGAANQVAHHLRKHGVGPDSLVAFCVDRSMEMVIGLLGILKAGGAYLTIDANSPVERLASMFEDAKAKIFLTTSQFRHLAPADVRVICLDEEADAFAAESCENLSNNTSLDNLAYVLFTSGSTGKPKGVCVPHRGVVRLVKETNYVQVQPDDVFLQFAPVSFDASTLEIWAPLLNGARLAIFPPGFDSLEQLADSIAQQQVTVLWLTAGLFHQMVERHTAQLRGLRALLAGGDVLSPEHILKASRELPKTQLINGYGPTENTTFTCCHLIPRDWPGDRSVPIGKPISNTQVYILDQRLQPTPIGVPGEIFIGGDGLAREYLNAPDLTAEKFIVNPFDATKRSKLYRTGDLARWLATGGIEFLGRIDSQVKIRGFRVELGEIESALNRDPDVRESAVMLRRDGPTGAELVAYVVPIATSEKLDFARIKEALKKSLPAYMVPSAFVQMDTLPLNANGKVEKKALPAPVYETQKKSAPRTPSEEFLLEVWEEVLGRRIGVFDNFFDVGGHSLLATQIVSRIRTALEVDLRILAVFNFPTVASLAEELDRLLMERPQETETKQLVNA